MRGGGGEDSYTLTRKLLCYSPVHLRARGFTVRATGRIHRTASGPKADFRGRQHLRIVLLVHKIQNQILVLVETSSHSKWIRAPKSLFCAAFCHAWNSLLFRLAYHDRSTPWNLNPQEWVLVSGPIGHIRIKPNQDLIHQPQGSQWRKLQCHTSSWTITRILTRAVCYWVVVDSCAVSLID